MIVKRSRSADKIAARNGFDHRPVVGCRLFHGVEALFGHDDKHLQLGLDILKGMLRLMIVGQIADALMEREVMFHQRLYITSDCAKVHRFGVGCDACQIGVCHSGKTLFQTKILDQQAEGKDIVDVFLGEAAHERAAPGRGYQHAALFQSPYRLADGIAADAKVTRQLGLVDAFALMQTAKYDFTDQEVSDLIGQHAVVEVCVAKCGNWTDLGAGLSTHF